VRIQERRSQAILGLGGGPVVFPALLDSFRRAQRPGKAPTLDTYRQRDANCRVEVQAFVTVNVIPRSAPWALLFMNLNSQMEEASTDSNPLSRALKLGRQQLTVIKAGRAALEGATVPPSDLFVRGKTRQAKGQEKLRAKPVQADAPGAFSNRLLEFLSSRSRIC
jgi:hypothetical protein